MTSLVARIVRELNPLKDKALKDAIVPYEDYPVIESLARQVYNFYYGSFKFMLRGGGIGAGTGAIIARATGNDVVGGAEWGFLAGTTADYGLHNGIRLCRWIYNRCIKK